MRLPILPIILLALLLDIPAAAQAAPPLPTDPGQIRKELRALRKRSSENDPNVRSRIDLLLKQLQKLQAQRDAAESQARGEDRPEVDDDRAVMTREKMWEQTQKIAEKGKGAEVDLAEPVRDQIVKVYEEDRDPSVKNPDFFQQQTLLVLDLSRKESKLLIAQLENFRGITTLVVTGGKHGAPVDLQDILGKARHLPLKELYIFNFKNFLTTIPESIAAFSDLETLALFNNNLARIPAAVANMHRLKVLHIDMNPITTVLPTLSKQFTLRELGVGKTKISAAEQAQLAKLLPECRIVTQ